jgi:hypothetical protein
LTAGATYPLTRLRRNVPPFAACNRFRGTLTPDAARATRHISVRTAAPARRGSERRQHEDRRAVRRVPDLVAIRAQQHDKHGDAS